MDYESWTRSEIEAAQTRVVDLQRALDLFLGFKAQHEKPAGSTRASSSAAQSPNPRSNAQPQPGRKRASKNGVLYEAFEQAGPSGLTVGEVQRIAEAAGLTATSSSIRAFCWTAKQAGRLISLAPGRYAIPQIDDAAPELPEGGEGAASTRAVNDRHREGDEGGGT
jgi:hypothetical protein